MAYVTLAEQVAEYRLEYLRKFSDYAMNMANTLKGQIGSHHHGYRDFIDKMVAVEETVTENLKQASSLREIQMIVNDGVANLKS